MTEAELVRQAQAGEPAAFEALVTAYENKIYNLALRYLGSRDDAEDASQEVFLRVFRFLPGFHEESSFSTWIYRIAVNVCKDMLKAKSQRAEQPLEQDNGDEEESVIQIPDSRYEPETVVSDKEQREILCKAILSLPEPQREILILRDVRGLSYDEIAEVLSLEIGTVKSRIARARENLRKKLLQNGNIFHFSSSKDMKGGSQNASV